MEGAVTLFSIQLTNLLSFDNESLPLKLQPLNVLIGPNGSGKTNLIEAIQLLRSVAVDLETPIRESGGVHEWKWKAASDSSDIGIHAIVNDISDLPPFRAYNVSFRSLHSNFTITEESVSKTTKKAEELSLLRYSLYSADSTKVTVGNLNGGKQTQSDFNKADFDSRKTLLSQFKSPAFPELNHLASILSSIRIYKDWDFSFTNPLSPRRPQPTDRPTSFLEETGQNLALIMNKLIGDAAVERVLNEYLAAFYYGAERIHIDIEGNTAQIFLIESAAGRPHKISAARLSDGTLRWLSLLAILLHPDPPGLVCIEEPEIGLHPDIMPTLARLLLEASQRMQLIVTTHSDTLVDALSEVPEAIVVCEKVNGATALRRPEPEVLSEWLQRYTLGQIWSKNLIGGNRW